MRCAGTRRAEHSPLRFIPMFQAASLMQGPTEAQARLLALAAPAVLWADAVASVQVGR